MLAGVTADHCGEEATEGAPLGGSRRGDGAQADAAARGRGAEDADDADDAEVRPADRPDDALWSSFFTRCSAGDGVLAGVTADHAVADDEDADDDAQASTAARGRRKPMWGRPALYGEARRATESRALEDGAPDDDDDAAAEESSSLARCRGGGGAGVMHREMRGRTTKTHDTPSAKLTGGSAPVGVPAGPRRFHLRAQASQDSKSVAPDSGDVAVPLEDREPLSGEAR